jgi:hypothetical protein
MLLYALLHLSGVKAVDPDYETLGRLAVEMEDIRRFRQLDSKCPGHPEYRWTSGVEATTGPLGQGVATSVGMAIAARWLGRRYNRPGFTIFDHDVRSAPRHRSRPCRRSSGSPRRQSSRPRARCSRGETAEMRVAIAADHAGFALKREAILSGRAERGVLVRGSGGRVAIAVNELPRRAATAWRRT